MFFKKASASVAICASLCLTAPAFAVSHSDVHRIATKAVLTEAVEAYCTSESSECTGLRTAARSLYADPSVVTQDDVMHIDALRATLASHSLAWRVMFSRVRGDLLAAVDKAEAVTFHVLYMHEGKWQRFELCDTPS